jgi:hypothetical protein
VAEDAVVEVVERSQGLVGGPAIHRVIDGVLERGQVLGFVVGCVEVVGGEAADEERVGRLAVEGDRGEVGVALQPGQRLGRGVSSPLAGQQRGGLGVDRRAQQV